MAYSEINPDELNGKVDKFFNSILDKFQLEKKSNKSYPIKFITVNHMVPTLPYFLKSLEKIGNIAVVIPKSSFKNEIIFDKISKEYPVFRPDNDEYSNKYIENNEFNTRKYLTENWKDFILKYIGNDSKFLVIDIGGYFSSFFFDLKNEFDEKFIGIVEDTENGHQKYQKNIDEKFGNLDEKRRKIEFNLPIMSVARCSLKNTEDYNVGKSIVEAASTILRESAHTIIERMNLITVIGFGKIGRSIAEHLRQKNVKRVVIYDKSSLRIMEAVSLGFEIENKDYILSESDMIFGATGNHSIENIEFGRLKDNVFIASCTSREDEFSTKLIERLDKNRELTYEEKSFGKITQYKVNNRRINMLHRGDAVNFVYGATNGPYIYSVQAALLVSALKILNPSRNLLKPTTCTIQELDKKSMTAIANLWLEVFEKYSDTNKQHLSLY